MVILTCFQRQHARKDSRKVYITKTSRFNKLIIIKMYILCCSADGKKPVGYYMYRHEFHKMYVATYKPNKQCNTCVACHNKKKMK